MTATIAIVGSGPRGISVLERLASYLNAMETIPELTVHLIDDARHGSGRVWDAGQTRNLCMNTLAQNMTLFTEPGATVGSPVLEGPTLFEWVKLLRGDRSAISTMKVRLYDSYRPDPKVAKEFAEEIATIKAWSHPSRALCGAYFNWALHVATILLPREVTLVHHFARLESIQTGPDRDILSLSDSSIVEADATALASGWISPGLSDEEERLAAAGLNWIRPDNPLDQPVHKLPEGGDVLVRGLGMGFFDVMTLLTKARGGTYERDSSSAGGLKYVPAGGEPTLYVASNRGYPFLPKSEYGSMPPRANLERFERAAETVRDAGQIDFAAQLWPAIVRDAFAAYYTRLSETAPGALLTSLTEIIAAIDGVDLEARADTADAVAVPQALTHALAELTTKPLDLAHLFNPLGGFEGDIDALTQRIAAGVGEDIVEAERGYASPVKAALRVLSEARRPASIIGSEGQFTWESRTGAYAQFAAVGQMVGSGPPLFRTRELLALIEAGLVKFVGPGVEVLIEEDAFVLKSGEREARSATLIDAWMHHPDIRIPADDLTRSILDAGRVRPFRDNGHSTGSPEVDPATRLTVNADGSLDRRLHIVGIPTYAQLPATTIAPMSGTDSLMLQETDKTARSLLVSSGVI